jgi:prepilin-type N-terminal cleavage/methylation domain-containing protein
MHVMSRVFSEQDGFTLLELLVVVIVLAILAAIVVGAIGSTRSEAVHSGCATRVRSIARSAEAVRVKTSAYPSGTVDGTTSPNPLVAPQAGALLKGWPTSSDFVLRYVGTGGSSYTIVVYKSDGVTDAGGCTGL